MAFEKLSHSIQELNENVQALVQSNAEYYKLKAFKSGMKGATSLVLILLVGFFVIFAVMLLSVALAIVISEAIGSPSSGYFIVGGFYLLVGILIFIFGKGPIEKLMLTKISKSVFKESNDL
ncbi:phage holin family protein [Gramella sp. BOM4]|nr:phage holin family protein [Christiangramia bathymodioli]